MIHTPITYDSGVKGIFDTDDNQIAHVSCADNMSEFIVRACNAHDELLAAAKLAQKVIATGILEVGVIPSLISAIAKAEGK